MRNFAHLYICAMIGLTLLVMCGDPTTIAIPASGADAPAELALTPFPATTPLASLETGAPSAALPVVVPDDRYPEQPADVVYSFLAALQSDPSGAHSLPYLSPPLAAQAAAGTPVTTFLGVAEIYQAFVVEETSHQGAQAQVESRLRYSAGEQLRRFKLGSPSGVWQIVDIIDTTPASAMPPAETAAAEQTVRDYVTAFAGGRTTEARALLSPGFRARLRLGDLGYGLSGLDTVTITRMQPINACPERVLLLVTMDITLQPDHPTPWVAGASTRFLTVVRTERGWLIDDFSSAPPAA